jgi:hypothetical protein
VVRPAIAILLASVVFLAVAVPSPAEGGTIHLLAHPFDPTAGEPSIEPRLQAVELGPGEAGYFLVQLTGPPTDERKADVGELGGDLIAYVPDDTYIVRMTEAARASLSESPSVRWIGPYHPAYKVSPDIGSHEFVHPKRAGDSFLTLTVRVFEDLNDTARRIVSLGGRILDRSDDGFQKLLVVHAAPAVVSEIARLRDVWWIEEKPEFVLMNDTTCWVVQSNASGSMPVWDHGIHGEDQIVGVMDSGLDYNSCWFREVGAAPPGPSHRKVIDYSLYGGVAYDGCDIGHGTHVCGTLAGDQSYINAGNYSYNGMAYKAKIALQDVGEDDEWSCSVGSVNVPSSLTAAFSAAYGLGARFHTNSWGSTSTAYDSYSVDVDNFMWSHQDFLVCFAAGNSGPSGSTVGSPGTAKNCITAGATRRPPNQSTIASYSSRGPTPDNRYKPTVVAPGGEAGYSYINSADNNTGNPPAQTCNVASDPFQGTSMATPAICGTAVLVRQYYADGWYPNGTPTAGDEFAPSAALVKATVVNSATDISTPDIPNNNEGWGRVLLDDALYFDGDARELVVEDVTPGLTTGGSETYELEVDSSMVPLEITLVWTDYPATSGASVALQNNLDLSVTHPGGQVYKGNVMSGGISVAGGSYDNRNVEEVVRFDHATPGMYTIEVTGASVPHGPQPFALVSTGSFAAWPPNTGVDHSELIPSGRPFDIGGISPNPFNPSTTIDYTLRPVETGEARTTLRILSVDGRVVATLVDRVQDPGRYSVVWNGKDAEGAAAASGVYFCELSYGGEREARKMTLLK